MSNAIERLSKIVDVDSFCNWYDEFKGYKSMISDIQEVVALAKSKQQNNIDGMRFEAAKAAMQGYISHSGRFNETDTTTAILIADVLIDKLKKPNT